MLENNRCFVNCAKGSRCGIVKERSMVLTDSGKSINLTNERQRKRFFFFLVPFHTISTAKKKNLPVAASNHKNKNAKG
jgi:hypothetical protein